MGILLGFCFFIFFFNLNLWDLWNPDEPRYAQVAREMVNGGDWILMHLNGEIYGDKPPFFFWLIALSSYLWQGFNSFSVRFPSALFGTLTVLLTFFFGKSLYSSSTGFFSGLILGTSIEFAYLATRANIDTTLTFFTTASLYCFLRWYHNTPPNPFLLSNGEIKRGNQRTLFIYGFYICMALATLAKGPIGFILPLLVSLGYLCIQRDWNLMRRMKLLSGMALCLCIVLLWYLPAAYEGGKDYLQETLFKHTVDAYAKGWTHVRPIYYYLINFPIQFLPWFFFFPAAIVYGFSKESIKKRKEFLFLLTWFALIFLFFSISKGKRGIYLLPLFPAASLMVGKLWNDFIWDKQNCPISRWFTIPVFILIGFIILTGIGGVVGVLMKFPQYFLPNLPLSIIMVAGSILISFLYMNKKRGAIFLIIIMMMGGGFFYLGRIVFPMVNPYKSARFISHEITSRIKTGEKLAVFGDFVFAPYNYYTGIVPIIELENEEDFVSFLKSEERVFCLLKFRDFIKLQKAIEGVKIELITRRSVGGDDMVLISNK